MCLKVVFGQVRRVRLIATRVAGTTMISNPAQDELGDFRLCQLAFSSTTNIIRENAALVFQYWRGRVAASGVQVRWLLARRARTFPESNC
jgi:hypothetical protein